MKLLVVALLISQCVLAEDKSPLEAARVGPSGERTLGDVPTAPSRNCTDLLNQVESKFGFEEKGPSQLHRRRVVSQEGRFKDLSFVAVAKPDGDRAQGQTTIFEAPNAESHDIITYPGGSTLVAYSLNYGPEEHVEATNGYEIDIYLNVEPKPLIDSKMWKQSTKSVDVELTRMVDSKMWRKPSHGGAAEARAQGQRFIRIEATIGKDQTSCNVRSVEVADGLSTRDAVHVNAEHSVLQTTPSKGSCTASHDELTKALPAINGSRPAPLDQPTLDAFQNACRAVAGFYSVDLSG